MASLKQQKALKQAQRLIHEAYALVSAAGVVSASDALDEAGVAIQDALEDSESVSVESMWISVEQ